LNKTFNTLTMEMTSTITKYLEKLEAEKTVKILLACETGSRAWGFPSLDSDFDVRMIYVHPLDWYLKLSEKKDSIEVFYENNALDFTGFDLRKTLRLLKRSNVAIIERIQSPIIYKEESAFSSEMIQLAKMAYSRIASIHHYMGLANKYLEKVSSEAPYKLKSLFYFLRASYACKYILENETIIPIEFNKVLDNISIKESIKSKIEDLIKFKATTNESYMHSDEAELIREASKCLDEAKNKALTLPSSNYVGDAFDSFFKKYILE